MWAYLFVFNDALGTREEIQDFLDDIPEVSYWYSCFPNCVFFTSSLSAIGLAKKVHEKFGESRGHTFLITEVHKDRQGWLPSKAWRLFGHPHNPRELDK